MKWAAMATSEAVIITPTVARTHAGQAATRSVAVLVAKPESNRMMASATLPTKKAACPLSKTMPSGPSSPASSPTVRKMRRSGAPNLKLIRLVNTDATTSAEPMNIARSIASNITVPASGHAHGPPGSARPSNAGDPWRINGLRRFFGIEERVFRRIRQRPAPDGQARPPASGEARRWSRAGSAADRPRSARRDRRRPAPRGSRRPSRDRQRDGR